MKRTVFIHVVGCYDLDRCYSCKLWFSSVLSHSMASKGVQYFFVWKNSVFYSDNNAAVIAPDVRGLWINVMEMMRMACYDLLGIRSSRAAFVMTRPTDVSSPSTNYLYPWIFCSCVCIVCSRAVNFLNTSCSLMYGLCAMSSLRVKCCHSERARAFKCGTTCLRVPLLGTWYHIS